MKHPLSTSFLLVLSCLSLFAAPPPPPNGPGAALSFDGVDDFVRIPYAPDLTVSDHFTLEFWFKPASLSQGANYLLSRNGLDAGGQSAVIFGYSAPNEVEFYALGYSGANPRTGSQIVLPDTEWHHLSYSYDGVNWAGYRDGTQIFNVARTFSLSVVPNHWLVGAAFEVPGADNVAGVFDEVRIWNISRSGEQIRESMRRQLWGNENGLLGYCRFETNSLEGVTPGPIAIVGATYATSTILPFAPSVTTHSPTVAASATLTGTANPNNASATGWFEWGTTASYGDATPSQNLGNGTAPVSLTQPLSGLTPGVKYHCRAVATNLHGASYGADQVFGVNLTNIVQNLNHSGPGSLQAAILDPTPGVTTITFAPNLAGTLFLRGEIVVSKDLDIQGPKAQVLTVSMDASNRLFNVVSGRVRINGLTLGPGYVRGIDGQSGSFPGSSGEPGGAACGGGILNRGELTLVDCVVADCQTRGGRGGDAVTDGLGFPAGAGGAGGSAFGSAICNSNRLVLQSCTIYNNSCFGGSGGEGGEGATVGPRQGGLGGNGGGAGGAVFNAGFLYATNCTFCTNGAEAGHGGQGGVAAGRGGAGGRGGIAGGGAIRDVGTSAIVSCTIVGNSATAWLTGGPGGIGSGGNGVTGAWEFSVGAGVNRQGAFPTSGFARNSLFAHNLADDVSDCAGPFVSGGFNLIGLDPRDIASGFAQSTDLLGTPDSTGIDPRLGPLGYHGGQTPVFLLLWDSPAIDRGHSSGMATDQRGQPRVVDDPVTDNAAGGDGTDIGAYERSLQRDVTNLNDDGPGSLRHAIYECRPHEILRVGNLSGTITLTSGEIVIDKSMQVIGSGASRLTISGNNASRIFRVMPNVTVAITKFTIRDGAVVATGWDANGNGLSAQGGGILNSGTLILTDCFVLNNRAIGADGNPLEGGSATGGGIYHEGARLEIERCTIRGNSAIGGASGRDQIHPIAGATVSAAAWAPEEPPRSVYINALSTATLPAAARGEQPSTILPA